MNYSILGMLESIGLGQLIIPKIESSLALWHNELKGYNRDIYSWLT